MRVVRGECGLEREVKAGIETHDAVPAWASVGEWRPVPPLQHHQQPTAAAAAVNVPCTTKAVCLFVLQTLLRFFIRICGFERQG